MAAINAQALYSNVTTENYVRRVQNINPNRFSQSVLQISDQQSRDKNYEKSLEYIRTYIASLQAKINSLVEELNTLYENTLTETLFRRADSKNTAKKVNKLTNATSATGDGVTSSLKDAGGRTDVVQNGYDGETRMFGYNPFFGTRSADLSNYYNLLASNDVSAARAYYQNADNTHHELGASAMGAIGYLWLWDVDRINTTYATTMDKYVDQKGIMHLPTNDPLLANYGVTAGNYYPPKPVRTAGMTDAAYNALINNWQPLIYSDPAMNIVGANGDLNASAKLQVNITALQPNRGIVDLSGIDAPKKILPIPDLSKLGTYQAGNIDYTNGQGYNFTAPPGNQLFFDTEKWAIVDANGIAPTMTVIPSVTKELVSLPDFGTYAAGAIPDGGSIPAFDGWVNRTGQAINWHEGGQNAYWNYLNLRGGDGGGVVHISHELNFAGKPLYAPPDAPPEKAYAQGTLYADDGWTINVKPNVYTDLPAGWSGEPNIGGTLQSTPSLSGSYYNQPDTDGVWSRLYSAGGSLPNSSITRTNNAGNSYSSFNLEGPVGNLAQTSTVLISGIDGNWSGGNPTKSGLLTQNLKIGVRTVGDPVQVERYYVDENGKIFDRFGTGSNGSYGHFNGSTQVSNAPNPAPVNPTATGSDDYKLYDYVPNITNPSLTSTASIPDITNGDFFYYRETLNAGDTINLNRPNISFDPRRTNIDGKLSVTNNRVQIQNTDFAMFASTHLTYVEQNQDVFNQTKKDTFVSWGGLSDKDLVGNNQAQSNTEKDYLMKLNFENKDANGTGILSAVTRVHVKAVGEPTVQVKVTEEWDSVKWKDKPVKHETIGGFVQGAGTPELTASSGGTSSTFSLGAVNNVPVSWIAGPTQTIVTDEPWEDTNGSTAPTEVTANVTLSTGVFLDKIKGKFKIDYPTGTPGDYGSTADTGDLVVRPEYFDGTQWREVLGSQQCVHINCSGSHGAWESYIDGSGAVVPSLSAGPDGYFNFELDFPQGTTSSNTKFRIAAYLDGNPLPNTTVGGKMDLEAITELPVYNDKNITRTVNAGGTDLTGYRDAKLTINLNNQENVPGADEVNRRVEYSINGGTSWVSLIVNPPEGPITVDIPSGGPIQFRTITDMLVEGGISVSSEPHVWDIGNFVVDAQPIPENPKTLGLEMTKGFYKGVEQTGNGTIINPLSDTQAGYVAQEFYTGIDGVAGFNMYLNNDEYNALLRKNALVNDATLQVEIEYYEDSDQNGRIDSYERGAANLKTKLLGVDDATRFQTTAQNKVLADTDSAQANKVYSNTLVASSGRSGGADAKTENENKFTKRLKQVIDSQEWQEVMRYGLMDNIYIAATTSDNRGDQITGKLILNWDWQRRYIDVTQGSFTAIYKA